MRWVSAVLTFVNFSAICGVLLGMVGRGLNVLSAALALVCGAAFGIAAFLTTSDPAIREEPSEDRRVEPKERNASQKTSTSTAALGAVFWRYRRVWFWLMAVCFAVFAVRSFCWLFYIDGSEYKIQNPNNLGDLSLHITLIKTFANGVPLWPDNPIFAFSKLRYPAGIDLFNALLYLVHVDLTTGFVWVGLVASIATFYAFYRWGGTFAVAGFLFNGGIAGFQFFKTFKFIDYQGDKSIAWKSIPLSMFVTQRGWLYAIPAGLVLLWHWRQKFFTEPSVARGDDAGRSVVVDDSGQPIAPDARTFRKGPLPFWLELSLYASMPLFHLHTFLALTIVLLFALLFERPGEFPFIAAAPIRRHSLALLIISLLPASFFVWLVTDHFRAASILQWHPGWVQDSSDFAAPFFRMGGTANFGSSTTFGLLLQKTWNGVVAPFFQFWLTNFGLWVLLALALVGFCVWRIWKGAWRWGSRPPADIAFVLPALAIFTIGYFCKTAPWDWDNLKLMVWGYFIILPFLWSDIIGRWAFPERAVMCIALFGSGFVTLLGGLTAGHPGFGMMERARLDGIGSALRPLPVEARFAAYPTYNHPLLLQGRKVVLGYPGHLWTEGFDYGDFNNKLTALMNGAPNWRDMAKALGVRYMFWGQDEKSNYQASSRPWEKSAFIVASGDWGAIYDLDTPAPTH